MCGIAGLLLPTARPALGRLAAMCQLLRHRGPDDVGYLLWSGAEGQAPLLLGDADTPESAYGAPVSWAPRAPRAPGDLGPPARVLLGHRRLSIVDLSPAGHQPMGSADGARWLVYNGEVYNHVELREELSRRGHVFRTTSDTEVVLAAHAEWGAACIERFVGMWAFALVDLRRGSALLARDPFGIKPLYTATWEGGVAFASEQKALRALPGVGTVADPSAALDFLALSITDHRDTSFFAGIRQLPAGCVLEVSLSSPAAGSPRRYWRARTRQAPATREAAAAELRETFLRSVALHLRADVPVGACLSGGIDSSSIVCAMRSVGDGLDLHAFTYSTDEPRIAEEGWARLAAEAAGATIHITKPSADELARDVDALIDLQDAPFGSTSAFAQRSVFRLAQGAGLKVMLDGQGADEMLCGYRGALRLRLSSAAHGRELASGLRLLGRFVREPGGARALVRAGLRRLVPRSVRSARGSREPRWLREEWFAERGVTLRPAASAGGDPMREARARMLEETSLPALLRLEDRNSMACSIESRVPFVTVELAEQLLALPAAWIVDDEGTTKAVFRRAMRGLVPDPILDRRDKVGFETPERSWLVALRPWVEATLASEIAAAQPFLDMTVIRAQAAEMLDGRRSFDYRLWRWLNLVRWLERTGTRFE